MTIIDGKKTAADIRAELKVRAAAFEERYHKKVGLAVVLIGEDPASQVYVRNKIRGCEDAGIRSFAHYLPADVTQEGAEELVRSLAADDAVHGILVQLPLPGHLDAERILACIPAAKDVDGFSAENIGRLALHEEGTVACTPLGVMELLRRYGVETRGKRAVVLVAAIGKPDFVTADMVKEGAVVIDVGINRVDGKLTGDVDYASVSKKASLITPVPGGVGPMTIAMLLSNAISCAERAAR